MKILDTSSISSTAQMPFKGGSLLFLQLAYQEGFTALMQANIGAFYDPTKGYILYGCVNGGTGTTYNISAGAVFFNGFIYLVPAASFTLTGSNVAEGVITTTQYTSDADPVAFTDGVSRNVHNIQQIVFQNGLAGSGAFDYVNAVNLACRPVGGIGQTVLWSMPDNGEETQNELLATYFNAGAGIHPLTLGWQIESTLAGYAAVGYKSGDSTFGTIGQQQGSATHILASYEIPTLQSEDSMQDGSGSNQAFGSEDLSGTPRTLQINEFPQTVGGNTYGEQQAISLLQPSVTKLYITRIS